MPIEVKQTQVCKFLEARMTKINNISQYAAFQGHSKWQYVRVIGNIFALKVVEGKG